MITRERYLRAIAAGFRVHPIVSILGPRQIGKSTLARMFAEGRGDVEYFDLENPVDRRRLSAPMQCLGPLRGLVVLDEIQRCPELFEVLRVLADRTDRPAQFLILGSASPDLIRGVSESLAGRVCFVDVAGLTLEETGGREAQRRLWLRGGFPRSFLADSDEDSLLWREHFIRTFLERDIPQFGLRIPSETLRRFWVMLAHYHGQIWNGSELARSLGASEPTARRYLDILSSVFMVRVLPPWHENLGKRQVKSPKVYLRDSGLLLALLELGTFRDLEGHPRLGAVWEGFALEQVISQIECAHAYFWAAHGGAELDLLIMHKGKRYGFEFKYGDAPGRTRAMHSALEDLKLDRLWVVYPGEKRYELSEHITVSPLADLANKLF